jgi:hypothetical protein
MVACPGVIAAPLSPDSCARGPIGIARGGEAVDPGTALDAVQNKREACGTHHSAEWNEALCGAVWVGLSGPAEVLGMLRHEGRTTFVRDFELLAPDGEREHQEADHQQAEHDHSPLTRGWFGRRATGSADAGSGAAEYRKKARKTPE